MPLQQGLDFQSREARVRVCRQMDALRLDLAGAHAQHVEGSDLHGIEVAQRLFQQGALRGQQHLARVAFQGDAGLQTLTPFACARKQLHQQCFVFLQQNLQPRASGMCLRITRVEQRQRDAERGTQTP